MNNARILVDMLVAAVALTTPLFHSKSATSTVSMAAFISPTVRRPSIPRIRKPKILAERNLTYTVTATAYEAVPGQTDDEPFVTADNSFIKPHYGSKKHWLALSRDLLKQWGGKFNYGDKVRVCGLSPKLDGIYTVHDTMNRRHRHCMDILVHPSEHYDLYCKGVKIQKIAL